MITSGSSRCLFLLSASVFASHAAFGQTEFQLHARQLPGWDARTREGRCVVRVWVDNRAEVRMRGDAITVRTLEGSRGRDDGSECSQPMPYNSVQGFRIKQTAGRNPVTLSQEPGRMNNFTAVIAIDDRQGGGDNYAFEVTWQAEPNISTAPAPFFDDVRACQDTVRQRFLSQNGRGSYIDFDGNPERRGQNANNNQDRMQRNWKQGPNRGQESIQGRGTARNSVESRELTYSCFVDTRQNQVVSGVYQLTGNGMRGNGQSDNRRALR